jgi:hypothetical protein
LSELENLEGIAVAGNQVGTLKQIEEKRAALLKEKEILEDVLLKLTNKEKRKISKTMQGIGSETQEGSKVEQLLFKLSRDSTKSVDYEEEEKPPKSPPPAEGGRLPFLENLLKKEKDSKALQEEEEKVLIVDDEEGGEDPDAQSFFEISSGEEDEEEDQQITEKEIKKIDEVVVEVKAEEGQKQQQAESEKVKEDSVVNKEKIEIMREISMKKFILKRGFLNKLGHIRKSWKNRQDDFPLPFFLTRSLKKRFFELDQKFMYYFKNEQKIKRLGFIEVSSMLYIEPAPNFQGKMFIFKITTPTRTWFLQVTASHFVHFSLSLSSLSL